MLGAAEDALATAGVRAADLAAIGITNQRETTVVWERRTGRPVGRAIVWQDRRTAERCRELPADLVRARTGLVCDPYFSATKLEWLLARTELPQRELAFGTVDSWLVWKLTGGRVHATDETNASRTMLLDLATRDWDDELLASSASSVSCCRGSSPRARSSPRRSSSVRPCRSRASPATSRRRSSARRASRPARRRRRTARGASCSSTSATRRRPPPAGCSRRSAARARRRAPVYALEGAVLVAGAALQWLRDGLGLIDDAAESEALARSVGLERRRRLRPGADRSRIAVLGSGRARARHRPHARDDARASRPRGARGDRAAGRGRRRRGAGRRRAAACRRRCRRQRLSDAAPGRSARRAGRGLRGRRGDRARCGRARRAGRRRLERAGRRRAAAAPRRHALRAGRGRAGELEALGERWRVAVRRATLQ